MQSGMYCIPLFNCTDPQISAPSFVLILLEGAGLFNLPPPPPPPPPKRECFLTFSSGTVTNCILIVFSML